MKLIIGLGNPGSAYSKTRHNVGHQVLEKLRQSLKGQWKQSVLLGAKIYQGRKDQTEFVLALPDTFMNQSGQAVKRLVQHFKINPASDLLIVLDEASLPFGKLRIRPRGSDGGHRGLRSVALHLGTSDYARLRVGIAPEGKIDIPLEEYVLSSFTPEEEKELPDLLAEAERACLLWLNEPIEKVMNQVNPSRP